MSLKLMTKFFQLFESIQDCKLKVKIQQGWHTVGPRKLTFINNISLIALQTN